MSGRKNIDEVVSEHMGLFALESANVVTRYLRLYTGILDIDMILRPTIGKAMEILGAESVGKTTMMNILCGALMRTCSECFTPIIPFIDSSSGEVVDRCQCGKNTNMRAMIIDLEDDFDEVWASRLGVDTVGYVRDDKAPYTFNAAKTLCVARPTCGVEALDMVIDAVANGATDGVFIDSVANLYKKDKRKKSDEKGLGAATFGDKAKIYADFMPKLSQASIEAKTNYRTRPTIVWTNQYRANMERFGSAHKAAGGWALKYGHATRMEIYKLQKNPQGADGGSDEDGAKKAARVRRVRIYFKVPKNKAAGCAEGSGLFDLHTDDMTEGSLDWRAGETREADAMWDLLQELELAGKGKKNYYVLNKEFNRVKDIKEYLTRPDINYSLRFVLYNKLLPATALPYLKQENFDYGPFESTKEIFRNIRTSGEGSQKGSDETDNIPTFKVKKKSRKAEQVETESTSG